MKFVLLLSLLILSSLARESKPNYYKIMGLRHGSSTKDIKKAFKKFAIKYHPDKAPSGKKEEYEKKFQKVSDAYSLLMDKVKKSYYDRHGHEGLEQAEREQNFKNQRKANQERYQNRMGGDIFQGTDVLKLGVETLGQFYRRIGVWIVLFYRGSETESVTYKDNFVELNNRMYGIFTVAGVNCETDGDMCEEYRALDTPAIMIFTQDVNQEPERYTGNKAISKISGFAVRYMEDYVRVLTKDNLEEFLEKNLNKPKIILFTNKKSTPPLLKVLSKEFKESAAFGIIKKSQNLVAMVGSVRAPTIFAMGATIDDKIIYKGDFKKTNVVRFIRDQIHDYEAPDNANLKKVIKIDNIQSLQKAKCANGVKSLCFIYLTEKGKEEEQLKALQSILGNFSNDPINFAVMRKELLDTQSVQFQKQEDQPETWSNVQFLLLKPSKKKIKVGTSNQDVRNFLDMAMSGSIRYSKIVDYLEDYIFELDEVDL